MENTITYALYKPGMHRHADAHTVLAVVLFW